MRNLIYSTALLLVGMSAGGNSEKKETTSLQKEVVLKTIDSLRAQYQYRDKEMCRIGIVCANPSSSFQEKK